MMELRPSGSSNALILTLAEIQEYRREKFEDQTERDSSGDGEAAASL